MTAHSSCMATTLLLGLALAMAPVPATAQLAVSANDNKLKLVDGKSEVAKTPAPDTIAVIDLGANPVKLLAEIEAPASVVGPPTSVAVTPNEQLALVTSAQKLDPADPTKQIPDDRVTVIDLSPLQTSLVGRVTKALSKAVEAPKPPVVIATVTAGKGASGISINRAGTLALVANRNEGTISIFTIKDKTVTAAGKVDLGNEKAGPSAVAFAPDGRSALVTRDGDNMISVLAVDGAKVTYTKRDMTAGMRPYGLDITAKGDAAVVANIGAGTGDSDTVSVIDMKAVPPRVVNTVTVGQTPEGIKLSPDGRYLAVIVMNGSNKLKGTPFFNESGKLIIYGLSGTTLTKIAEAPTGKWCQGVAWSKKSTTVLAQCMVEEQILVYKFGGITAKSLQQTGAIKVKGGPAGIRTAE